MRSIDFAPAGSPVSCRAHLFQQCALPPTLHPLFHTLITKLLLRCWLTLIETKSQRFFFLFLAAGCMRASRVSSLSPPPPRRCHVYPRRVGFLKGVSQVMLLLSWGVAAAAELQCPPVTRWWTRVWPHRSGGLWVHCFPGSEWRTVCVHLAGWPANTEL